MFINPYRFKEVGENYYNKNRITSEAGIISCKRDIFIIENPKEVDEVNNFFSKYRMCSILLINYVKYKLDDYYNKEVRIPYGVELGDENYMYIKSTYRFSSHSPTNEKLINNFFNLRLYLDYSHATAYQTDFNDYYFDLGVTLGGDFTPANNNISPWCINLNSLSSDIGEDLSSFEASKESLYILDPRFYNEKQFEIENGFNYQNILTDGKTTFYGKELVDEFTNFYSVERSYLKPLNSYLSEDKKGPPVYMDVTIQQLSRLEELPIELFQLSVASFYDSYLLVYDSKLGVNFDKLSASKEYLRVDRFKDYGNFFKKAITKIGKRLTKEFGNLRIMLYNNQVEDYCYLLFDDIRLTPILRKFDKKEIFENMTIAKNPLHFENTLEEFINYGMYSKIR